MIYTIITSSLWIGTMLFMRGFLLTRKEISTKSTWTSEAYLEYSDFIDHYQSSMEPSKKVFLFIIDALRKDLFTSHHFPHTFEMLRRDSSKAHVFGFLADPPTTTSQRLKAMTTGTMPTFIDLGSNFDSSSVTEDSIIHQLRIHGKTNVVMGDDTWQALFPTHFNVSLPFDSFNTKDLHGVDLGILNHLWTYYNTTYEWDLFVAHFLGVDHIGHSHSAFHPLMHAKLLELDDVLVKVISHLPEDAVLFMFGDHGMTDDGNHGGATPAEVESVLLIYDNSRISVSTAKAVGEGHEESFMRARSINQIDLVPTISLLQGLPIPYSSLGAIIPELFDTSNDSPLKLAVNSIQVGRYLSEYFSINKKEVGACLALTEISCTLDFLHQVLSLHRAVLNLGPHDSSSLCTDTELIAFDYTPVPTASSVRILRDAVLQSSCLSSERLDTVQLHVFLSRSYTLFLSSAVEIAREKWTQFDVPSIILGSGVLIFSLVSILFYTYSLINKSWTPLPVYGLVMIASSLFHSVSSFSNSFIIEEHWMHLYMVQSGFLALLIQKRCYSNQQKTFNIGSREMHVVILISSAMILVRCAWQKLLDVQTTGFKFDSTAGVSGLLATAALAVTFMTIRYRSSRLLSIQLTAAQLVSFAYLVVKTRFDVEDLATYRLWVLYLPRFVTVILFIHTVHAYFLTHHVPATVDLPLVDWMEKISVLVIMVTGADAGFQLLCLLTAALLLLYSLYFHDSEPSYRVSHSVVHMNSLGVALHLSMMGRLCYFLTLHRFDFGTLQLSAGFVGADTFNFAYAGTMLAINTFGYDALFVLLALLTFKYLFPVDYRLHFQIPLLYRAIVLIGSVLAAGLHRRHLMVWAVFAPKCIFEATFFVIYSIVHGLGLLCISH